MGLTAWPAITDDSGTKADGTIIGLALFNLIKASIEASAFGLTDPSRTPGNTTDEVIAARGSKASLDARLDVALNEDGTPKSVSGQATNTDLQSQIASRNVAQNGDLSDWSAGAAAAPDSFTLSGAGATIARTGAGEADTFTFGTGVYAAKLTRVGADVKLLQSVISAVDMPGAADYKGKNVAVFAKGKTAIASHLRIIIDDGVTTSATSYHTGGGTSEDLTKVHTISASATKLEVYASVETSNGAAYVGGLIIVFSNLAPGSWKPFSAINDASLTSKGLVNLAAQSFAGLKNFNTAPLGLFRTGRISGSDFVKNNSVTLSDVTGLSFAVAANEEIWFAFFLQVNVSTVADLKVAITGPAAPTGVQYAIVGALGPPGLGGGASAFATSIAANTSNVREGVIVAGYLRNGANAGTVQLQAAQNNLEVSASTIYIDSFVVAFRKA